uniref:DUF4283 domain-containing protein n=1 Tax=Cannabis sativa TaxID=3483 RepID=A0A803QGH3_CANSA
MEEVLGVEPFELFDEEEDRRVLEPLGTTQNDCFQEPLTPRSSLNAILQQEVVQQDFNFFLTANLECSKDAAKGIHATAPVLRGDLLLEFISVCYILGENPPLNVLDGFVRRLWKDKIDKVGLLSYGIFFIRFHETVDRDSLLKGGYIFFNKRPVIMKAWHPNVDFKKEDVSRIPIWITLDDLELKYWGEKSLFKIIGQIGESIMVNAVTKEQDKLSYPRVLIEVSIHQEFPHTIYFENEHGMNVSVTVSYEWKPILCKNCKGMGHETIDCRKKDKIQQEWVMKRDARKPAVVAVIDKEKTEDFQPVTKGWKVRGKRTTKADSDH